MSESDNVRTPREEIRLYIDKAFQASLGYFTILFALFALSNTSYIGQTAGTLKVSIGSLFAMLILVINLIYLTLLCSCLFAILKRGLFILCSENSPGERQWEVFARDPSRSGVWCGNSLVAWNIDNYFMIPVFIIIVGITFFATYFGWQSKQPYIQWFTVIAAASHLIPCWMLWCLGKLNAECHRRSKVVRQIIYRDDQI